jgi:hypothetical protein
MNGQGACLTVTVSVLLPAVIVMVAVRVRTNISADTVTCTVVEPAVPEEAETLHQLWSLLTVQSVLEVIVNGEVPPALGKDNAFDDTVRVAGVTVSVAGEE